MIYGVSQTEIMNLALTRHALVTTSTCSKFGSRQVSPTVGTSVPVNHVRRSCCDNLVTTLMMTLRNDDWATSAPQATSAGVYLCTLLYQTIAAVSISKNILINSITYTPWLIKVFMSINPILLPVSNSYATFQTQSSQISLNIGENEKSCKGTSRWRMDPLVFVMCVMSQVSTDLPSMKAL